MKKYIVLVAIAFIGCNKIHEEKTITLTNRQLMTIYHNGWISGALSYQINDRLNNNDWVVDSLFIYKSFFDNND